ncbi:hypothetical protein [Corynebacterium propinquum]|nr:hypothetical protein [Corynebacterium propinquum]
MPTESVESLFEDEHVYNQGLEFFRPRKYRVDTASHTRQEYEDSL